MGNIFTDIVEDVQVKPSQTKLVLKWVVRIAVILIGAAFTYGQVKSMRFNKMGKMEESLNANTKAVIELRDEVKSGFEILNDRVDKVYDDGFKAFNDFQQYNNKQLGMIIDYGGSNKEMLKRMLEITTMEKTKGIENQLQQAKSESSVKKDSLSIKVTPLKK
jgi:hypothetical protein